MTRNYLLVALLGVVVLFSASEAQAQTSVALSVSPTIFEMTANPGQEWNSTLRIINTNPFPLTVYANVVNFRPLGEAGASQFFPPDLSDNARSSLAEWITVPTGELVIPPEETLTIPVVINPPSDVPPGGHYAAILVGTKPPEADETTSVETAQYVSTLVFLRVAGDITESGSIRSFRTNQSVYERPEVEFALRFQNDGNVHLRPEGEITIYNMWGQERGFIPVNQRTLFGKVLSESTRTFTFSWTGEWSPADIGRYRAVATLAYGEDGRQFVSSEVAFWIIPWRVLLGFLVVIGLIVFGISWSIKLYIRRMLSLAGLSESPLRQQLRTNGRTRKTVSVIAPIEAGMLDLRTRFTSAHAAKGRLENLWTILVTYRIAAASTLLLIVTITLIIWFIGTVTDNNRSYEVTIDSLDADITINSEQLQYDALLDQLGDLGGQRDVPPLRVVNRSGVSGTAAQVAYSLSELGYTILSVDTELDAVTERTVVVYDPAFESAALDLSVALNNAPLSSYDAASHEPLIVVYVGRDLEAD